MPARIDREPEKLCGVQAHCSVPPVEVAIVAFVSVNSHVREAGRDLDEWMIVLGETRCSDKQQQQQCSYFHSFYSWRPVSCLTLGKSSVWRSLWVLASLRGTSL